MNKDSILFSITLAFLALFIFSFVSFIVLMHTIEKRESLIQTKRALDVAHLVLKDIKHKHALSTQTQEYLELFGFESIKSQEQILQDKNLKYIWMDKHRKIELKKFTLNEQNYLLIEIGKRAVLLLDKSEVLTLKSTILVIFLVLCVAFLLLYLNIINKLKPLATLQNKVKSIGEENFDIRCSTKKRDEISQLANEFDSAVKKLKSLKESRNVFIRNIMHELKTPIAKGQFLTQLPNTEKNAQSMQKVFYRLESLINEFASIEELISTKKEILKKEYSLSDVVDNASDILMNNEQSILYEFENIRLEVDFKLFSIAVKNLLDNGIKYSKDRRVSVQTKEGAIYFKSRGERLKKPLENYFEPFSHSHENSRESFGLGLYIVKHILDANNLLLDYNYFEGHNFFIIKTK